MWRRRSHLVLTPLTSLLSIKRKFVWTAVHQHAFECLKAVNTKEVLLSFPDYSKPFHLYTDASDYQIGAVLTQDNQPIAFFSWKLTDTQRKYGVGTKEMLNIERIPHYPLRISRDHSHDHKNLAYDKTITTLQIFRWRLAIEEFMHTLVWVPGVNNPVADLLSHHPIHTPEATEDENFDAGFDFRSTNMINLAREYTVSLNLKQIYQEQLKDPTIKRMQRESPEASEKYTTTRVSVLDPNTLSRLLILS
jgi:hypothetical protein